MNYEPFYERCRSLSENDRKWAEQFCKTLDDVFDGSEYQSTQKVRALFYGKGNGLSKAQFYRKKKFIVELYQWLYEEGIVPQRFVEYVAGLKLENVVSDAELDTYYFKDVDAMLNFISEVGRFYGFKEDDDLLIIKSISLLTWYSVDISEMIRIRKTDLNEENHSVYVCGTDKRTVTVKENAFGILRKLAAANAIKGFPAAKLQVFQSSRYLFRSARQGQLNENNLNCFLKRFNKEAKQFGHELSLTALKKNGIFCAVLEKDDGKQTINMIMNPMLPDRQMAFGYAKFYQVWKDKFYT